MVEQATEDHTTNKWQSWDVNLSNLALNIDSTLEKMRKGEKWKCFSNGSRQGE